MFLNLVFNFFFAPSFEASVVFFLVLKYHNDGFCCGDISRELESLDEELELMEL